MSELTTMKTHWAASLSEDDISKEIQLSGWVSIVRDLGGIKFVELRDRSGVFQVVSDPNINPEVHSVFQKLRSEDVITVKGVVSKRPEDTYNESLKTGTIEMYPVSVEVLSKADVLPFQLDDETVSEDLRLKYRYLDIRRGKILNNLSLRHKITKTIRDYLDSIDFMEVETPILIKTTPEGARDYLVPSRVHPNKFYALPQSPQIFKQLLMVGGVERYFQIARCFRDEDLRADRQPEFTQVDIEMSFVKQDDVLSMMEGLIKNIFKTAGVEVQTPIKRIKYKEAMDRFGSDKPDTRFGLELFDVSDIMEKSSFVAFSDVIKNGGTARAIKIPGIAGYSRKDMDDIRNMAISFGAKGLAWVTYCEDGSVKSPILKYLSEAEMAERQEQSKSPGLQAIAEKIWMTSETWQSLSEQKVLLG